ncbi:MarR family transcriptional regulator [Scopulibacillus darangshiensis]|uniref:MarR family transcriptional regulator n=1 Tax=Scopulibacillus darangshiensis TaxID=442528 RepID=A0A4R2P854_9BACL|nr:MarR family transcriptional regulator [Scopulibacillus darangshiensis]TCP30191.1 MarR family transcriptional regulator [Scopulibacillus darangshiensis]
MHNTIDAAVGYPTVLTGRKIVHLLFVHLKSYDITPEQWTVLRYLGEQDGITQKELSQKSGKDQATLTRILDNMDRKTWIERKANSNDRRSFLVYLTDSGERLRHVLEPSIEKVYQKVFNGISEEQIALLKITLEHMERNIEIALEEEKVK